MRDPQRPWHVVGQVGDPQSLPEDHESGDHAAQQDDAHDGEPDHPGGDAKFLGSLSF